MRGHHLGTVVGVGPDGWTIDYAGNPHGPIAARTTLQLDRDAFQRAAHAKAEVLLVFERERSDRPIVVGLVSPRLGSAAGADARPLDAEVDGERVVLTATQEIVLRCGKASIHLSSDGAVRIRGTNVLSRASATNRIRGGNVQVN